MARVTRRVASTVTLILAVVALGACGGGTSTKDKNAYAERVNAAQTKFSSTVATAASEDSKGKRSLSRQQRTLRRFDAAIANVIRDLRNIDAPSEVSQEHDRLISVMIDYGDEIEGAGEAMRNPTPRESQVVRQRLAAAQRSASTQVNAAIAAINVKLRGE
jgi:predicted outer membrane protein